MTIRDWDVFVLQTARGLRYVPAHRDAGGRYYQPLPQRVARATGCHTQSGPLYSLNSYATLASAARAGRRMFYWCARARAD